MKFSKEERAFIEKEIGIKIEEEENDVKILDRILEESIEIEIWESNNLEVLTETGQMAVSLVTRFGKEKWK